MAKKTNVSSASKEKGRWSINRKASWIASLAASVALSLGLVLGTASKENKNYGWNHNFSHNLKEIAEWSKKIERGEPVPILTWKMLVAHEWVPYEVRDSIKLDFDVDEHFDLNTHIINWNWYNDLESIMRDVASGKDTSAVVWFDYAKKDVEPNLSSQSIKISSVEWYASPEAVKYEWSSVKIWNIESENIATAEYRAEVWRDSLMTVLTKICVENPDLDIDASSITISWDEVQLNDEELKILEDMASFAWYPSVESMIYANEKWEIEDASVVEVINKIINSKRNVIVTFTKKWNPDTIYVLPLVILPILIFRRKKNGVAWWGGTGAWWGGTGAWWRTGIVWWRTGAWWRTEAWWRTGAEWWRTRAGWGGTGTGWWTEILIDGPWPWPPKPRYVGMSKQQEKSYIRELKTRDRTEKPMIQRKQPRDKRPHNFSNERQWRFNRSRRWRTN